MRVKPSVTNALEVCQDAVDRSKSQRYSRSEIQFAGGAAMAVSQKVREFMEQGSWIRKMFEEGIALRQRFGDDAVFDLSLGNPILEPPDEFFAELKRIADDPIPGMHRYMPNAGYPETRAAVAAPACGGDRPGLLRRSRRDVLRRGRGAQRRPQDAAPTPVTRWSSSRRILSNTSSMWTTTAALAASCRLLKGSCPTSTRWKRPSTNAPVSCLSTLRTTRPAWCTRRKR